MACLYDCKVEDVAPGNKMMVEGVGWCLKLAPQEGVNFNAVVESVFDKYHQGYTEQGEGVGRLVLVPPGTVVISGYGWGNR